MPFQANDAALSIGGMDIGFVKSISISKKSMRVDGLEFKPVPRKTITLTGWIVRPKILKSKSRQPRQVRVVNKKNPSLGGAFFLLGSCFRLVVIHQLYSLSLS